MNMNPITKRIIIFGLLGLAFAEMIGMSDTKLAFLVAGGLLGMLDPKDNENAPK